jgi:glycosyltransferase involved in cell wall biosynthesis
MRVVIDLQGAQASNKSRGIGRYALSLAQALVRHRDEQDVVIVLNGLFPDTIGPIRAAFRGLLPTHKVLVWNAPGPVADMVSANDRRRAQAQDIRSIFLASLKPDLVLITSLFEGLSDDAVVSVDRSLGIPTAVVLYDLIPLLYRDIYLADPNVKRCYLRQLEQLKKADLLLSISESSRQEALTHLSMSPDCVINISSDCDSHFSPRAITLDDRERLRFQFGISRSYVMYTGGVDHRKNLERLIRSYAQLSKPVREEYQLVIVCSVQPTDSQRMAKIAREAGLALDELVMTGYVSEEDLVCLYNACQLFVFPSWHEGFGLPALEAMRCGKAVIASATSSLPEVVGWSEALFNPLDESAITAKMMQALSDPDFRSDLSQHGQQQALRFSWDRSAQLTWSALREKTKLSKQPASLVTKRKRLACVSPLPAERSGISDYTAQLLPVLSQWYDIDVVVDQQAVADDWISSHCKIRSVQWFKKNHSHYDRVLYHMGNSHFHQHMFDLLNIAPGVVVLHDFFLSGIQTHRELQGLWGKQHAWTQALHISHGYAAVKERLLVNDPAEVIWKYPCNLQLLQSALGIIVHSDYSKRLADQWYGAGSSTDWAVIPLLRQSAVNSTKLEACKTLKLPEHAFVVCSFGLLGQHKLNHRLLNAFLNSDLAQSPDCHLVFVGQNHQGQYGEDLLSQILTCSAQERIHITGWLDTDTFSSYLTVADIGVQLRTLSRGETSAAVLDCMNNGLATIVNANGSMADLDAQNVWLMPDEFQDTELSHALETLWRDPSRRHALGQAARQKVLTCHAPQGCAKQYTEAIENFYHNVHGVQGLIQRGTPLPQNARERISLAKALAQNFPPVPRQRQLLVDVSELVQRDAKTGIQRVSRAVLLEWLSRAPSGWCVQPVYAVAGQIGYRYAQRFTCYLMGMSDAWSEDAPVDTWPGDVFVGLDLQPRLVPAQQTILDDWYQRGVEIRFVVYDLLPLLMPQAFVEGAMPLYQTWLQCISRYNGAVCISKAVALDLHNWIKTQANKSHANWEIDWFHLGADVDQSAPSKGLPAQSDAVLKGMRQCPSFLMVGTLEPRKGHAQVLEAFEQLWQHGQEIKLVIVGKSGWKVDTLIEQLKIHPEMGHRLVWLEGVSDEYLEKIYRASTCLISASMAEGFGLPLIEASRYGLPILARDIPVFREVAGIHADYFQGITSQEVAASVKDWLAKYKQGIHTVSTNMPSLSWRQSAQQLMQALKILT